MTSDTSMQEEALRRKIAEAFRNERFPGPDQLLHASCQDESEVEDFLAPTWSSWRDVPAALLDHNYSSPSFFSPAAYRFFLPAYLIRVLDDPAGTLALFIVYNLTPPDCAEQPADQERMDFFISKAGTLNREQREAVAAFLVYRGDHPQYPIEEASEALHHYWARE